jgi:hypothetical protein
VGKARQLISRIEDVAELNLIEDSTHIIRMGNTTETMLSCRRALECIAVCIVGNTKANRVAIVAQLVAPCRRQAKADTGTRELWGSIQDFLNLAMRNQGQPMSWNVEDSEVCLLCRTALLATWLAR